MEGDYKVRLKSVKIEDIQIAAIIAIFILSASDQNRIFPGMAILAIFFLYLNIRNIKRHGIAIPKIAVALLVFQNFSIGIGAHMGGYDGNGLSFVTQIPTLFIGISCFFVLLNEKLERRDMIYLLYVVLCFLFFFRGTGSITDKVTYFRNFILFYMAFCLGRYYLKQESEMRDFIQFFMKLAVLAALFGLLGMFLGTDFYHKIGVMEVYTAKHYVSFRNNLPGNFYTIIFGKWVSRLASFYYEPVNFSYFMALACILAFVSRKRFLFFFFLLCEILTFGKGGYLILGLTFICYILQKLLGQYNQKYVRRGILICAVLSMAVLVYVVQTYFTHDFGTYNHFYGIYTGLRAVRKSPWGNGLGSAGNLIKTIYFSSQDISETGLVNMAYQIGIPGTVLFMGLIISMAGVVFQKYRNTNARIYMVFSFVPFIIIIASVFQENTITPQCITGYMLVLGGLNYKNKNQGIPYLKGDRWKKEPMISYFT